MKEKSFYYDKIIKIVMQLSKKVRQNYKINTILST